MRISKHWLQEFIDLKKVDAKEIARRLTLSTVEVEGIQKLGENLEHIVVGKIISVDKHPNADKLKICVVDLGKEKVSIVCGGSNVAVGMLVAVAKVGAKVRWHGEGELVELKPAEIRGVKSAGMICASDEIGLGELFPKKDEKEILDLSHLPLKPGMLLQDALHLDNVIFEIDNKSLSNRPDLWGHYGVAREIGALIRKPLRPYKTSAIKSGKGMALSVDVAEKKLCSRYMAVAVDGVSVGPSPDWLQARLRSVGVRSINNVVDVTNFVMFELGQPMHAFDADRLRTSDSRLQLIVRAAHEGETLVTLDGVERHLHPDMLVIADKEKALAVAGVIGGMDSAITNATKTIIFESATFDPVSIRRTSTKLGVRTESSARFEKSLDPMQAEIGLQRAVELLLQLCPDAKVVSAVVDKKVSKLVSGKLINIAWEFFENKIGVNIPKKDIIDILQRLGFGVASTTKGIKVTVPSWRATKDISIPEDIVEEVIRIWGYEKIPATLPAWAIAPAPIHPTRMLEKKIVETLALECRATEVSNYSFVSPAWIDKLYLGNESYLELDNPIAKDRPYLRRSLLPNLLENVESNLHRFERVSLFEIGRVFDAAAYGAEERIGSKTYLPYQPTMFGLVFADKNIATPWIQARRVVEALEKRLGVLFTFQKDAAHVPIWAHPGRVALLSIGDTIVGRLTEIHPAVLDTCGIPARTAYLKLNLDLLAPLLKDKNTYEPIPLYPDIVRDIAFVLDRAAAHRDVARVLTSASPLIASVDLFDVYQGEHVAPGKKSMAYHIVYRSADKTLTALEADAAHREVEAAIRKHFSAEVRQ